MKLVNKMSQFTRSYFGKSTNLPIGEVNEKQTSMLKVSIKHFVPNKTTVRFPKIQAIGFDKEMTFEFIPPLENHKINVPIPIINKKSWMAALRIGSFRQIALEYIHQFIDFFQFFHNSTCSGTMLGCTT